ncbi:hypothetical protein CP533_0257 [Ophiocordyceps camponoti-saundersi (nom. inval.)]|nr:hypothetical protein CP533_0257 [Ophiocordyceps camponoti-saundersi (nom. inval.)]
MRVKALIVFTLVSGVIAIPATTSREECTRDGLFTSLSRHGRSFCSSLVEESGCRPVTTPTEYASFEPSVVSSRCHCVLTEICVPDDSSTSSSGSKTSTYEDGTVTITETGTESSSFDPTASRPGSESKYTSRPWSESTHSSGSETGSTYTSGSKSESTYKSRAVAPPVSTTGGSSISTWTGGSSSSSGSTGSASSSSATDPSWTSGSASTSYTTSGDTSELEFELGFDRVIVIVNLDLQGIFVALIRAEYLVFELGFDRIMVIIDLDLDRPKQVIFVALINAEYLVFKLGFDRIIVIVNWNLDRSKQIILVAVVNRQKLVLELGFNRIIVKLELGRSEQDVFLVTFINGDVFNDVEQRILRLFLFVFLFLFHLFLLLLLLELASNSDSKLKSYDIVQLKPNLDSQSRPHRHIDTKPEQQPKHQQQQQRRRITNIINNSSNNFTPPKLKLHNNLPLLIDIIRHNKQHHIRAHNATIPFPFIEAVDFTPDGVKPLFLTLRDAARGTHYLDVSDRGHVAIVDSLGNAMMLDAGGIHFSTNSCRFDVSFHVQGLYQQLEKLSGQVCAKGGHLLLEAADDVDDDDADAPFGQTLFLQDQCGHPVGRHIHEYPLLRLGSTECRDVDVDEAAGRWRFDCAFPGQASNASRCRRAVRRSVPNFLFVAPFADACPDLSTVITTLEATSQDFLNPASLREDLYSRGLDAAQKADADLAVIYYEQLWEILKQALSRSRAQPPAVDAAIKQYLDAYSAAKRRFDADLCRDLHAPDPPLDLTLRAGGAPLPVVARFASAPPPDAPPPPRNLTVLDPSQRACCPHGSDSTFGSPGACYYPQSAILGDSGCVCGRTAAGGSIAFEYTGCDNFVARCSSDNDCASAGYSHHVCLTGSCCGGGVCVDPYECSRNDTGIIPPPAF